MSVTSESPRPGEKVFVSCYRYDPFQRFVIHFLIPSVAVGAFVGFVTMVVLFYYSLDGQIPSYLRGHIVFVLAAIGFMGASISVAFLGLAWNLNRRYFQTTIRCHEKGLVYQQGNRKFTADWAQVRIGRVMEVGRFQWATVYIPHQSFQIDPSYVSTNGPPPRVRASYRSDFLEYPDGERVAYKIRENELFALISERGGKTVTSADSA